MDELKKEHKLLLRKVDKIGTPTTSDIKEQQTIKELYSNPNSINNALNQLHEESLLDREKTGRTYEWELSNKGARKLRKIQESESSPKEEVQFFDEENAQDVLEQFFKSVADDQLDKAKVGRRYAYLDFEQLEKFDAGIADELLENPDAVIEAAEDLLKQLPDVNDEVEVRVRNISDIETQSISSLSADDLNQLVTVTGVLQSVSAPKLSLYSAIFECRACGDQYEKKQDGKTKSPYKCEECGSRNFELISKEFRTVRYLSIKESPSKRSRNQATGVVSGALAEDERRSLDAVGSGIKIIGYMEPYKAKKSDSDHIIRLQANNIEIEDKWSELNIREDEIHEIEKIAERDDVRDLLIRSFAAGEIKHQRLLKEAFILWLLGRTEDGNLHMLCFGEPGTGKSQLARYTNDEFPRSLKSVAMGASGVGLTASVSRDKVTGEWVAEAGSLAMADGGFHITDEIDKLAGDDLQNVNEALSDQQISLDKANIHTELRADVAEFALGNPENSKFNDHEPAWSQIPIDDSKSDLKDRFDIFLAQKRNRMRTDEDRERERDVVRSIIFRGESEDSDEPEDSNNADVLSTPMLVNYITYAQRIDPILTREAGERMEELYFSIKGAEDEIDELWDRRRLISLKKLSVAYARLSLSEEVRAEHVEMASEFVGRCFRSMDFDIGRDSMESLRLSNQNKLKQVREAYDRIVDRDERKGVDTQELIEEAELDDEMAEEVVNQLREDGEFWEPMSGRVLDMD